MQTSSDVKTEMIKYLVNEYLETIKNIGPYRRVFLSGWLEAELKNKNYADIYNAYFKYINKVEEIHLILLEIIKKGVHYGC